METDPAKPRVIPATEMAAFVAWVTRRSYYPPFHIGPARPTRSS